MTAGTPSLNRPLDRSEAEARVERALKVARETMSGDTWNRDPSYRAHLLKTALDEIISILDGKPINGG